MAAAQLNLLRARAAREEQAEEEYRLCLRAAALLLACLPVHPDSEAYRLKTLATIALREEDGDEASHAWAMAERALALQGRIEPTTVFAEYQALLTMDPKTKSKNRGEQAASEVLANAVGNDPQLRALLLFEDSDITLRRFTNLLSERIMPISTGGLLHVLEEQGRIQSADRVLDEAMAKGRDVSLQRAVIPHQDVAAAFRRSLKRDTGAMEP